MIPHTERRADIAMSAEHFAYRIAKLPEMKDTKKAIVRYGRALKEKREPTSAESTLFVLSWRAVRRLLSGMDYTQEYERLRQLYDLSEVEYRNEIAKALVACWEQRLWGDTRGKR